MLGTTDPTEIQHYIHNSGLSDLTKMRLGSILNAARVDRMQFDCITASAYLANEIDHLVSVREEQLAFTRNIREGRYPPLATNRIQIGTLAIMGVMLEKYRADHMGIIIKSNKHDPWIFSKLGQPTAQKRSGGAVSVEPLNQLAAKYREFMQNSGGIPQYGFFDIGLR